jgi:hypothetical protein
MSHLELWIDLGTIYRKRVRYYLWHENPDSGPKFPGEFAAALQRYERCGNRREDNGNGQRICLFSALKRVRRNSR